MLFFISRDGTVWRNPWCCLRTLGERTWQNMPPICHASPPSWSTARTSFWTVWRTRMDRTIWSGCLRWVHVSLNVVTSCLRIVSLKFRFFFMIELLNVVIYCVEILFLKYGSAWWIRYISSKILLHFYCIIQLIQILCRL